VAHETVAELTTEIIGRVQDPSFTSARILRYLNQAMKEIAGHPRVLLPELSTSADRSTDTALAYVDMPSDYQKKLYYAHSLTLNREVKVYGSYPQLLKNLSVIDQAGRVIGIAVRGSYLWYQRIPTASCTLTAETISFTETGSIIADSAKVLYSTGFRAGDILTISGSTSNDGTYTMVSVESDGTQLVVSEDLTDEVAGEEITISCGEKLRLHYYKKPTTLSASQDPDELPEHFCRDLLVNFVCGEIFKIKAMANAAYITAKNEYQSYYGESLAKLIAYLGPEEDLAASIGDDSEFDSYL